MVMLALLLWMRSIRVVALGREKANAVVKDPEKRTEVSFILIGKSRIKFHVTEGEIIASIDVSWCLPSSLIIIVLGTQSLLRQADSLF